MLQDIEKKEIEGTIVVDAFNTPEAKLSAFLKNCLLAGIDEFQFARLGFF